MKIIDEYSSFTEDTEEEIAKTEELKKRLNEFLMKTHGHSLTNDMWTFKYKTNIGFISVRDSCDSSEVYFFGETIEEAFIDIISNYELEYYESMDPADKINSALSDFQKIYGNNIPSKIINYYKNYLLSHKKEEPKKIDNKKCLFRKIKKNKLR